MAGFPISALPTELSILLTDLLVSVQGGITGNCTVKQVFESNLIIAQSADIGGSGVGPLSIAVPGLTASSIVNATKVSSTNPCYIETITAGTDSFDVTFSADPGASAFINYECSIVPIP